MLAIKPMTETVGGQVKKQTMTVAKTRAEIDKTLNRLAGLFSNGALEEVRAAKMCLPSAPTHEELDARELDDALHAVLNGLIAAESALGL